MINIEEVKIGAEIIEGVLGEKSDWKDYKNDYSKVGLDGLLSHVKSEIMLLNDEKTNFVTFNNEKIEKMLSFISNFDGALSGMIEGSIGLETTVYEALEIHENEWLKVGLKLGMEIEKRKRSITKFKELNLSVEDLEIIKENLKQG